MLGFPLGILSAAGAGGVVAAGDYELIETINVSSSQASITFSSLGTYSSTYKHLQLRMVHKNSRANLWSGTLLRFNGDTGNNYAYHYLVGNGTNVVSNQENTISVIVDSFAAGNNLANSFSPAVYDILDAYSTTKNKTVRFLSGRLVGGGEDRVALNSGLYNSTSAISSITMLPSGGFDWVAGSRFSLYGIRG
jgi:hypothetical protein